MQESVSDLWFVGSLPTLHRESYRQIRMDTCWPYPSTKEGSFSNVTIYHVMGIWDNASPVRNWSSFEMRSHFLISIYSVQNETLFAIIVIVYSFYVYTRLDRKFVRGRRLSRGQPPFFCVVVHCSFFRASIWVKCCWIGTFHRVGVLFEQFHIQTGHKKSLRHPLWYYSCVVLPRKPTKKGVQKRRHIQLNCQSLPTNGRGQPTCLPAYLPTYLWPYGARNVNYSKYDYNRDKRF